jgi:hypothetical protein
MSFFSNFFGTKTPSLNKLPLFSFDERGLSLKPKVGEEQKCLWAEVKRILIITTDKGPLVDDVFWAFETATGGIIVPSETAINNNKKILDCAKYFSSFNWEVAVKSVTSAQNAEFVVWEK